MIWRPQTIPLRRLRLAGDHIERRTKKHVRELAASMRRDTDGRNLARVIVRAETMEVIAGHDRCSAAAVAGLESIACEVVSGTTPEQAMAITLAENAYRRHDERERQAAITDILSGAAAPPDDVEEAHRPGRRPTAKARAIAAKAAELGMKPSALDKAVRRAEQKAALEYLAADEMPMPEEQIELGAGVHEDAAPECEPLYDPSMEPPESGNQRESTKPEEDLRDRTRRQVLAGVRAAGRLWVAQLAAAGLMADAEAVGWNVDAIETRLAHTSPAVQNIEPEPTGDEESPEVAAKSPPVAERSLRVVLTCERCGSEMPADEMPWHFC